MSQYDIDVRYRVPPTVSLWDILDDKYLEVAEELSLVGSFYHNSEDNQIFFYMKSDSGELASLIHRMVINKVSDLAFFVTETERKLKGA